MGDESKCIDCTCICSGARGSPQDCRGDPEPFLGGGAWGLQQSTFMYSTPVTPAYVHTLRTLLSKQEQIKEITMEALRWRKSDRRASRGLALVRGRCVSDKEEFLELAGDLIPFPVSGGKRRGTK